MEYKDLSGKNEKELRALMSEERKKLQSLKLKRTMNQLKDVRELREIRKDVARMMTMISALKVQK